MRILDRVNPADMRNAYLDDPVDYRIPLWMLKVEYAPTINGVLQFLVIPDFEANYSAPAGSPFTYRVAEIGARNAELFPARLIGKRRNQRMELTVVRLALDGWI